MSPARWGGYETTRGALMRLGIDLVHEMALEEEAGRGGTCPGCGYEPSAGHRHGCQVRPPKCEVCRERVPGNRCDNGRCLDCHAKWCTTSRGMVPFEHHHGRGWPGELAPNS